MDISSAKKCLAIKMMVILIVSIAILFLIYWYQRYALTVTQRIGYFSLIHTVIALAFHSLKGVIIGNDVFSADTERVFTRTMKALMPSLLITNAIIDIDLLPYDIDYGSRLALISILFVWFIGFQYGYCDWQKRKARQITRLKKIFCGKISDMSEMDLDILYANGFFAEPKPMVEAGTRGTCFKCGRSGQSQYDLVVKIVDWVQWCRNRYPRGQAPHTISFHSTFKDKLLSINHKHVVPYEAIFDDHLQSNQTNRIYFVMPMSELNLEDFLNQFKPRGVSERWAHHWTRHLCQGLHYLHSNSLAHWNIKPDNILLYRSTEYGCKDYLNRDAEQGIHLMNWFDLKLSDTGFEYFMPMDAKITIKRDPIVQISPPNVTDGKAHDMYSTALMILVLMNGDIEFVIKQLLDLENERRYRKSREIEGEDPNNGIQNDSHRMWPDLTQRFGDNARSDYSRNRSDNVVMRNLKHLHSPNIHEMFKSMAHMTQPLKQLLDFMMCNQTSDVSMVMCHPWYKFGPQYTSQPRIGSS